MTARAWGLLALTCQQFGFTARAVAYNAAGLAVLFTVGCVIAAACFYDALRRADR